MRNKFLTNCLYLACFSFLMCGCAGNSSQTQQTYDGREFDISQAQNKSVVATSNKNGNNYSLTISGSGKALDYDKKEAVPWNPIIKKITSISINTGIENIGDYYFFSLPIEYLILPSTVTSVGDHSFNSDTIIYTYGGELTNIEKVYYYSAEKPTTAGNYFYLDADNIPHVWQVSSVLFIGNSFTYYQGGEADPTVPKYFKAIAENLGQGINVDYVVKGSHTLTKFSSATDTYGQIVDEKLKNNKYDYVILQEQSTTPINNYNTFLSAVTSLKAKIDATQSNCETILYETWGSPTAIQSSTYQTVGAMEQDLREAYRKVGAEVGCKVNYVGKAFTYAYETANINVYYEDNRHQNYLGAYLSAAVHVKSLYGYTVANCTEYVGLSQTECKALLSIADNN